MEIKQYGVYFADNLRTLVASAGGSFTDTKERPVVTIIKAFGYDDIYWTVPMGDLSHRTADKMTRINQFIGLPARDIRSTFYHIGNTDKKSLFFISDVIPINGSYIEREYLVSSEHYVIKNQLLIAEIEKKIERILAFERSKLSKTGKPYFRQNIFGILETLTATAHAASEPDCK